MSEKETISDDKEGEEEDQTHSNEIQLFGQQLEINLIRFPPNQPLPTINDLEFNN